MKCVKNTETKEIKRLPDTEAYVRCADGWEFIPKKEWKAQLQVARKNRE